MFVKKDDLLVIQDSVGAACTDCQNDGCNGCCVAKAKELVEKILEGSDPNAPNVDEYYDYALRHSDPEYMPAKVDPEKSIMYAILADLRDRRGLRQEFEACDQDIQEEIMAKWLEIIQAGGEK